MHPARPPAAEHAPRPRAAVTTAVTAVRPVAAVVFDLDGTLVDTMRSVPQAYVDTVRALGGPVLSPSDVVAAWHIGPTAAVLTHFLNRPATPEDLDHYHRRAAAAVAAARPFPGVYDMLDTLRDHGYRLALYTSATRRAATGALATTRLAAYFPIVVCGDEVREPKPAAEGLVRACRRLGLRPSEAAYVGDALTDMECAAAAGAWGIHAAWASTYRGRTPRATHPGQVAELIGTP
ncbi:HAD family hydrolase [Micromonospora sp. MS34]|uniref:HAD family hydrolase n=1 Tax=Micromonospora sp. MS34 TaxID=3385971 RepID=UPI00399FABE6